MVCAERGRSFRASWSFVDRLTIYFFVVTPAPLKTERTGYTYSNEGSLLFCDTSRPSITEHNLQHHLFNSAEFLQRYIGRCCLKISDINLVMSVL